MLGIIHFQSVHTRISLKLFANLEIEYRGLENIPKERKYLIASKHQSLAEAIFLNLVACELIESGLFPTYVFWVENKVLVRIGSMQSIRYRKQG